jgi:hypothetical protein
LLMSPLLETKVGRVTPCAPDKANQGAARRGLTRPTILGSWLRWVHSRFQLYED